MKKKLSPKNFQQQRETQNTVDNSKKEEKIVLKQGNRNTQKNGANKKAPQITKKTESTAISGASVQSNANKGKVTPNPSLGTGRAESTTTEKSGRVGSPTVISGGSSSLGSAKSSEPTVSHEPPKNLGNNPKKSNDFSKKFDLKALGLGLFIGIAGLIGYAAYDNVQENERIEAEKIAQEEALQKSYLSEVKFEDIKFSNEAVLFIPKGGDYREVEQSIKRIAQKHNIDVSKTVLTDDVEAFSKEQENLISTVYGEVLTLSKKILYKGTDTYNEEIATKTNQTYENFVAGEDIKVAAQEIANLSGAKLEEVTKYIEGLQKLENLVLTSPLSKDNGAVLVMFGENMEESRVYIDGTEKSLLEWHLVNNGFLNLNKEDQVTKAIEKIKQGGSYLISIGSNACMFCENTIPTVEEIALDKDVEHIYIDSNTLKNSENLESFVASYLSGKIEQSPTVVFVNDGKEISRFTGSQSYAVIEKFVRDSVELVNKKDESKEEATQPATEPASTQPATEGNATNTEPNN